MSHPLPANHALLRLDAYRVARDFVRSACALDVPDAYLRADLRKTSRAVLRNIAEGAGRIAKADKRRAYGIARGEAFECASILDEIEGVPQDVDALLSRVIALVSGLVR